MDIEKWRREGKRTDIELSSKETIQRLLLDIKLKAQHQRDRYEDEDELCQTGNFGNFGERIYVHMRIREDHQ